MKHAGGRLVTAQIESWLDSAATGLATAWDPSANGQVNALAASGGTVYAGGLFTDMGGTPRSRIAALDGANGLATAWDANANGQVVAGGGECGINAPAFSFVNL